MAVSYYRRQQPAAPEQIEWLQQRIGGSLPPSYRTYLAEQDGGRLENNNEAVNTIFGLGDLPEWASLWEQLDVYDGRVPDWLLPVADDEYGNLYAISLRPQDNGAVWFWDHEEEADEGDPPTEDNLHYKAADWQDFLSNLNPPPTERT
jgi:cell wall assembly regulator SMI1